MSKTIAIEFEGTLLPPDRRAGDVTYEAHDPGPTPGAVGFVTSALAAGYEVVTWTARAAKADGRLQVEAWLGAHGLAAVQVVKAPPEGATIVAARAVRFGGAWPSVGAVARIVPWYAMAEGVDF